VTIAAKQFGYVLCQYFRRTIALFATGPLLIILFVSMHSYPCFVGLYPTTVWTTSGKVCTDLFPNVPSLSFRSVAIFDKCNDDDATGFWV